MRGWCAQATGNARLATDMEKLSGAAGRSAAALAKVLDSSSNRKGQKPRPARAMGLSLGAPPPPAATTAPLSSHVI